MRKPAAIYARVSSDRQKENHTIASQTAALIQHAETQGYAVPSEWVFQDEGYSGASLVRPGLEALRDIKRLRPKLPVLVLSMHPEDQFAVRILKAGASGYLTKESADEELVGAIQKVVSGGRYISPSLAERMASYLSVDVQKAPHERLSDREFQVLRMIASGKTVSQIGRELSLSVKTISTYRARVLEKMDMKNSAELTHYAVQHNLVS